MVILDLVFYNISLICKLLSVVFQVFINTEMYARVSVAVLFYQLANLCNRKEALETEESLSALQCGKLFLLELLDSAVWAIILENWAEV